MDAVESKADPNRVKRYVTLVRGYVRGVDRHYADLHLPGHQEPGTIKRFALGMHCVHEDYAFEQHFDFVLVTQICRDLAVGRQIWVEEEPQAPPRRFDHLVEDWRLEWERAPPGDPNGDNFTFDKLWIGDRGQVEIEMRGIPYSSFGGPSPYHDLDVIEIFVPAKEAETVERTLRQVLSVAGATVNEVEGAEEEDFSVLSDVMARWSRPVPRRIWFVLFLLMAIGVLFILLLR